MRLLIVDDNISAATLIARKLSRVGFEVSCAETGEEALVLLRLYTYDLVLIELNLPLISGYQLLNRLRTLGFSTPIIVLTGEMAKENVERALGLGADDYVTKPFHLDELAARIKAVIRRTHGHAHPVIRFGRFSVDIDAKLVFWDSDRVHLTRREFEILEILAIRKGTTVTREAIMDCLYAGRDEPEVKTIDVLVCKLRRRLRTAGAGEDFIETRWGIGYAITGPDQSSSERKKIRPVDGSVELVSM